MKPSILKNIHRQNNIAMIEKCIRIAKLFHSHGVFNNNLNYLLVEGAVVIVIVW